MSETGEKSEKKSLAQELNDINFRRKDISKWRNTIKDMPAPKKSSKRKDYNYGLKGLHSGTKVTRLKRK